MTLNQRKLTRKSWIKDYESKWNKGDAEKVLKIYSIADGFRIEQKKKNEYVTRNITPKIGIFKNPNLRRPYFLEADTFLHRNDKEGAIILVTEIELNPELTKSALKNEAMRAIHDIDNMFCLEPYANDMLLKDVIAWLNQVVPPPAKKSGCYVATCVYGSYDCPAVWTLRRYRDETLSKTWFGRGFIRTYYAISPTLVKWFGKTRWFQKLWKPVLDKKVKALQEKGVKDTPYEDLPW